MNLRIPDPQGLVTWIHAALAPLPALHTGDRFRVVETPGGLFYLGDEPAEVGGPWPSLPALLRGVGRRRRRYPETEAGEVTMEVREWDGWFFRVSREHAHPFKQLPSATAEHFELAFLRQTEREGVFLSRAVLDRLLAIERAREAPTWGEFRRLLPPGEFASLDFWMSNGGPRVYREDGELWYGIDGELSEEELDGCVISAEDPLEVSWIEGCNEETYPAWTRAFEAQELPAALVEAYGIEAGSPLEGFWFRFPVDRLEEMEELLEAEGYVVTARLLDLRR